eukprot:5386189-Amphidinium_carterae.1
MSTLEAATEHDLRRVEQTFPKRTAGKASVCSGCNESYHQALAKPQTIRLVTKPRQPSAWE